jgi:hypothetical protein
MHHKLIKALIAEIRKMRQAEESYAQSIDDYSYELDSVKERAKRAERQRDQERRDEECRQYEREDIARKLTKAIDRNDEYDIEKYKRQLKNL